MKHWKLILVCAAVTIVICRILRITVLSDVLSMCGFDHCTRWNNFVDNECPAWYQFHQCKYFQMIRLHHESFADVFNAYFDVKGVYKGRFRTNPLNDDLSVIIKTLHSDSPLKVCSLPDYEMIYEKFYPRLYPQMDIVHAIHVAGRHTEPIVLSLFQEGTAFPKLLALCGSLFLETDCGRPLLEYIEGKSYFERVALARRLLYKTLELTQDDSDFRVYLLDLGPDNIVVNDWGGEPFFVDLDEVILTRNILNLPMHSSKFLDENNFSYIEEEICGDKVHGGLSDHNLYAVCYLLLWQRAPWPMVEGGLLYDAPTGMRFSRIQEMIDKCVREPNRFRTVNNLLHMMEDWIFY